MSRKILRHKDKEKIIRWLTEGESIRFVEDKIKKKYPKDKKMWLSSVTIQNFRKQYLQLEGEVLKDIQESGRVEQQQKSEADKLRRLKKSSAYKNKINEIADSKLDVARKILELDRVIESRIEYWYNAVGSGEETASKADRELRQFIDRQMTLLGQYKKFVEGLADKTVDYNFNITVVNDQIAAIRDAITECMFELDPEISAKFMEILGRKLSGISYIPAQKPKQLNMADLQDVALEGCVDA